MKGVGGFLLVLSCVVPLAVTAQPTMNPAASKFDPQALFAPLADVHPVNRYRAADGRPGPDYWQNRADYLIRASLDPQSKTLSGTETITYANNSPQALGTLWLQIDQNRYKRTARAAFAGRQAPKPGQHTNGEVITAVQVETADATVPAQYFVTDTRLRVVLPQPVPGHGGVVKLHIAWHFTVPGRFGGRTGWFHTRNGDIFEVAQWYPRMCVYDDLRGWNTLPFLNQEFYLEYGDFDYRITVPWNMIVVGSGRLVNPGQVLTATEIRRLDHARSSASTVFIRKPDEVTTPASRPRRSGTLTWHFKMKNTRDVAFAASAAYVWDAARVDLPGGKFVLAQSAYPVESIGRDGWEHATQYVKATLEFFSGYLGYDYPWPNAVAEAGSVGGMEYPGLVFDGWQARGKHLFWITVHEIGHSWFPMIVGSNERRDAWMDEGFNTFVDVLAQAACEHGKFAPKQDGEYAPLTGNPARDIVTQVFDDPDAPPILTRPDLIKGKYRHPVTYFKAAYGLTLLRDQVLGPQRFDAALRQYVHDWAYRHPSPSDFFRLMDSAAGEDLSWFWRGWFRHNWKLDLAVTAVRYRDNDPGRGALVTVANLGRFAMPARLRVRFEDGSTLDMRIPVATWMQHTTFEVPVPSVERVTSATIDPAAQLPDVDRSNNRFVVTGTTEAAQPSK